MQRTSGFKRLSAIFINNGDWYIAENDGDDIFWGFVILNGDQLNAEWGYICLLNLELLRFKAFLRLIAVLVGIL